MEESQSALSLESSLARTESDVAASLKMAQTVVSTIKKYANALKVGNLKDLQPAVNEIEKAELALRQQIATTKAGWNFDVDAYINTAFIKEVLAIAEQKGVRIFERDDRLYCYPVLIRILPAEWSVQIDKTKEKKLRPSVLVNKLKELQKKPPRFRPEGFLEALHTAYQKTVQLKNKGLPLSGTVISLLEIYELFTLMPGQSREYSKQEFARDIYLLDRSGTVATRDGSKVSFPASTGTKIPSRTLNVINEYGEEKRYYGIAFTKEA
ncbi:MAG: hypothetical protein HY730_08935 [Candidatus Tectomicrobia bacterium]|uniref:Uncharacterized protein n=1 Tax=Tectimicrobiota bacterium TaxID=2528274 RepID=A0A933GPI8_UNCTE|nr:hypothetical protein [Candidatus Tectomicrobia bacterium]